VHASGQDTEKVVGIPVISPNQEIAQTVPPPRPAPSLGLERFHISQQFWFTKHVAADATESLVESLSGIRCMKCIIQAQSNRSSWSRNVFDAFIQQQVLRELSIPDDASSGSGTSTKTQTLQLLTERLPPLTFHAAKFCERRPEAHSGRGSGD
jgi:hypothetical protein